MYWIIPELSEGSFPPYSPLVSDAGIPSIWNSVTSPENDPGAFPKINNPPHRPLTFSDKDDPELAPIVISSDSDVIIIGELSVPWANSFPPLAITSEVALAPVPGLDLIIVPAGIVKVTPFGTITLPSIDQITEGSNILSEFNVPVSRKSSWIYSHPPSSLFACEL